MMTVSDTQSQSYMYHLPKWTLVNCIASLHRSDRNADAEFSRIDSLQSSLPALACVAQLLMHWWLTTSTHLTSRRQLQTASAEWTV